MYVSSKTVRLASRFSVDGSICPYITVREVTMERWNMRTATEWTPERIKDLRARLGKAMGKESPLSAATLAKLIGYNQTSMIRIERGNATLKKSAVAMLNRLDKCDAVAVAFVATMDGKEMNELPQHIQPIPMAVDIQLSLEEWKSKLNTSWVRMAAYLGISVYKLMLMVKTGVVPVWVIEELKKAGPAAKARRDLEAI
jgi:DNA-binding XRE family transcriptional regulator